MANKRNGTLYIGMTNDLVRRVHEHKSGKTEGFSKRFNTNKLVYYESAETALSAIEREKQLKKWKRKWKLELVEEANPEWNDLYEQLI